MSRLLNKSALITGASSGIGAAIARAFARSGARVVLVGRNESALAGVAAECRELAGEAVQAPLCIPADLSTTAGVASISDTYLGQNSTLDVLVNNAGIIALGSIENTSLEQLDHVFNVNLRSIYELTRRLVPAITAGRGNIVNVSSVNGLRSFAGLQAYNISKAALDQFTRNTALELASKGVRVNGVNPGVIITQLQKRGGLDDQQYEQFLARARETHALGRPGRPEEVAEAVLFLADEGTASFVTGASLPVDGGRHAMCPR